MARPSSTGFPGVINHPTGRYNVRLPVNGRQRSFGLYATIEEAIAVAARARRGEIDPGTASRPSHRRSEGIVATPPSRSLSVAARAPQSPLPILHPPIRRPLTGLPDDLRRDPPTPRRDPLRAQRLKKLSDEELEYLRRMARGPVRHNPSPSPPQQPRIS